MGLRFRDRRDAGQQLAARLEQYRERPDTLVLGIPRGGIEVAAELARLLKLPLDVWLARKLGAPANPELAIGAVAADGTLLLDQPLIRELRVPGYWIAEARAQGMQELERRLHLYRGERPAPSITGKTIILADDGIATGATTIAALRALRRQNPARIVLAIPVAPPQVVPSLQSECDELVLLSAPESFRAVGLYYDRFEQVGDEQVVQLLAQAG